MKNTFKIVLNSWWGLHQPGKKEISFSTLYPADNDVILTKTLKLEDKEPEQTTWELTPDEIDELKNFVIKEKLFKKYKDQVLFDAGFNVELELNGKFVKIVNNVDIYDKIYNKLAQFVGSRIL